MAPFINTVLLSARLANHLSPSVCPSKFPSESGDERGKLLFRNKFVRAICFMQAALLIVQLPDAVFAHVLSRYVSIPGTDCGINETTGLVGRTALASCAHAVLECPLTRPEGDAAGTARV